MAAEYLGAVKLFSGNFAIKGYAMCQGQLLSIQQNTALFSLLGTFYGGNGVSTFQLPDLRGRVPINNGNGTGLSPYTIGQVGGLENVTLNVTTTPPHTHNFMASTAPGTTNAPANNVMAALTGTDVFYAPNSGGFTATTMPSDMVSNFGGSQPHGNIQPTLAITYLIALTGIFPSRN